MSLESKSDSELMELYKNDDMNAFEIIYSRYANKLYNFFFNHTGDVEKSNDFLQTTFLKIHKSRERYHSSFALSTWIYTIAKNLLKDEFKRKYKTISLDEVDEPASKEDPEDMIEKVKMETAIQKSLNLLSEDEKTIVFLSKYENMKYREIARILRTTTGAVKVKAHRAFKKLRKYLKEIME